MTAPADKTIPIRTPFTLTGSATDPDDDTLTYLWEQNDPGPATGTALINNTKTDGPLFRMFGTYADVSPAGPRVAVPGREPGRRQPEPDLPRPGPGRRGQHQRRDRALPGAGLPRHRARPDRSDCYSEFLPTAGYGNSPRRADELPAHRRDQFAADGAPTTTWRPARRHHRGRPAGPFLVTSRGTAGTPATDGGTETVTWNVAGTDTAALAPNVRITLSIDGGLTFPTELSPARRTTAPRP